ncbi:MAG: response regulator [Gemmatimonadetes bacterium]|nr:response regulator [Gemmatimonadota bacterium]
MRILIVDDEDANLAALTSLLGRTGYTNIWTSHDPTRAVARFDEIGPDLLLLDLHMPVMDGFQVLHALRHRISGDDYLPVLVLTGDLDDSVRLQALAAGARDFLTKPFDFTEVLLRMRNLLEARDLHQRLRQQNEHLEVRVRERTADLERAQGQIVSRLALAAEFRDDATGEHAARVGRMSALIAAALDRPADEVDLIRQAATLHDIGKIGIPDAILLKPLGLTNAEFAVMKSHVEIGSRILSGGGFPLLDMAQTIAATHHERWDGAGYRGLAGEAIPLVGRIVAVADAFDVLTSHRPYKAALPVQDAVERILRDRGRHFDPLVVDAFERVISHTEHRPSPRPATDADAPGYSAGTWSRTEVPFATSLSTVTKPPDCWTNP